MLAKHAEVQQHVAVDLVADDKPKAARRVEPFHPARNRPQLGSGRVVFGFHFHMRLFAGKGRTNPLHDRSLTCAAVSANRLYAGLLRNRSANSSWSIGDPRAKADDRTGQAEAVARAASPRALFRRSLVVTGGPRTARSSAARRNASGRDRLGIGIVAPPHRPPRRSRRRAGPRPLGACRSRAPYGVRDFASA